MDNQSLLTIIDQFPGLKVIVLGEAILESYVRGKAGRLNLEAPVPVVSIENEDLYLGGAANTALHAARAGASVFFYSVLGNDYEGDCIVELLINEKVRVEGVERDPNRKTRLIRKVFSGDHLIVRYDQGSSHLIDTSSVSRILKRLEANWNQADVIILSDYNLGLFTPDLLNGVARLQADLPEVLVADTRRIMDFQGIGLSGLITNQAAFENLQDHFQAKPVNGSGNTRTSDNYLGELNVKRLVNLRLDGQLEIYEKQQSHLLSMAADKPHVLSGSVGNAFTSAFGMSLGTGTHTRGAAEIGLATAGAVGSTAGLALCCLDELKALFAGDQKLVVDWQILAARLDHLRQMGKQIVFTNGVFDILHSAHVSYLNDARSFGDVLVVGVNSDESVQRLKGPTRPVNPLLERCRVLSGLECVSFVVPFGENNPINLIQVVKPDVYVKGGDYSRETLPETEVVEGFGGRLELIPYIANHSTTGVIEKIRSTRRAEKPNK